MAMIMAAVMVAINAGGIRVAVAADEEEEEVIELVIIAVRAVI